VGDPESRISLKQWKALTERNESMDHNDYLKKFFTELERLRAVPIWGRPHALTYDTEGFHVLLGLGDARASFRFDEMDADPIRMATAVMERWEATPQLEVPMVE
jgi:hypothetical protein